MISRRLVRPADWQPEGVVALEPNADVAVRSEASLSIIAGPGAGKTELLAQRATFLLQTGVSREPKRILAISFKHDAARNLRDRVVLRCGSELAQRFDCLTFDSFAKSLVDRFRAGIPQAWRPPRNYGIVIPKKDDWDAFLRNEIEMPLKFGGKKSQNQISWKAFEKSVTGAPLPVSRPVPQTAAQFAVLEWWTRSLSGDGRLTFDMLKRLAELVLRANPQLLAAMRISYSHVFVDEFQDTTQLQYDLLSTAFLGSKAEVTVVGDNKQRIMKWAGALDHVFEVFEGDFGAKRLPLHFNFRSHPALVAIQHIVARALDKQSVAAAPQRPNTAKKNICAVLEYATRIDEAESLAKFVSGQIKIQSIGHRDVVVLVKQKADKVTQSLDAAFRAQGIILRDESRSIKGVAIQDLLTEPLCITLLTFLRLGTGVPSPDAWTEASSILDAMGRYRESDDIPAGLSTFQRKLQKEMASALTNPSIKGAVRLILQFLTPTLLRKMAPQYKVGRWFEDVLQATYALLCECSANNDSWVEILGAFEGEKQVPVITIHKSKGLEYHTVLFVGLDDDSYWSMESEPEEAMATFFVALSRAKDRAFFTYCDARAERSKVARIYDLLDEAGVQFVDCRKRGAQ